MVLFRRFRWQHAVLSVLLLIVFAYQAAVVFLAIGAASRSTGRRTMAPFTLSFTAPRVVAISAEAARAGLRKGDEVTALDGVPVRGWGILPERFTADKKRTAMHVTWVQRTGGEAQQTLAKDIPLPLTPSLSPAVRWGVTLVVWLLLPAACSLIGFAVAFLRPQDIRAWLLLLLLLGIANLISYDFPGWAGPGYVAMFVLQRSLSSSLAISMLLFALYFPAPFTRLHKWYWLAWLLTVPLAYDIFLSMFTVAAGNSDYHLAAAVNAWLAPVEPFTTALALAAMLSFFILLGIKGWTSDSADARRRLKLLVWGTALSVLPVILLSIDIQVLHADPIQDIPVAFTVIAVVLIALFPFTMGYVVVVHRALDVRVVLRQGVQYAFAKGGVRVLTGLLGAAIMVTLIQLQRSGGLNRPQSITVLALQVMVVIGIRQLSKRLLAWTDRRFFREAYQTEVILSDLGNKVRRIHERLPLLETLSAQIAGSLHIGRVAVLLGQNGAFRPAYAIGYDALPSVEFARHTKTVRHLAETNEPTRVYLDDQDSWARATTAPEQQMLEQLGTQLLLPVTARDELLGIISLGAKRSEAAYSSTDVRLLQSVAAQAGLALENVGLTERVASEVAHRERLNREMEIAKEVQERLFPQERPSVPGLSYAGYCRPALGIGGDYYDFLPLSDGQFGIAIGDVAGKGIGAALTMASLQASLRAAVLRPAEQIAGVIGDVNQLLAQASSPDRYATFFYGQYHPEQQVLRYVNAGHNPPVLRRADGRVEWLECNGIALGILPHVVFGEGSVPLCPGDLVLAYTDGITEARNSAGEEWGEERLLAALQGPVRDPEGIIESVLQAVDLFTAGTAQYDDLTLVALCAVPQAKV